MALCKNGLSAVRDIWNKITPELEHIVEEVTTYTQKIKALEANPGVEAIVAIFPGGAAAEMWFNNAMDEIVKVADTAKTVAEKISEWLNGKTELEANGNLFKLASVALKHADVIAGNVAESESFYDSAVQLHVMVNKK
jgi:hypothetical protein